MEHQHIRINSDQVEYRKTLSKVAMILLLVAVIPIWPYVFYQILKLVIFGAAVYSAYLYNKERNKKWMWRMVIIAIIFNPINALYFGHFFWSIIDLIVSWFFYTSPK